MTNEKKPNTGGTQSSSSKTPDAKPKPGHGNKPDANKKPDEKGKTSGQAKR